MSTQICAVPHASGSPSQMMEMTSQAVVAKSSPTNANEGLVEEDGSRKIGQNGGGPEHVGSRNGWHMM